jgi:hypothetical protein
VKLKKPLLLLLVTLVLLAAGLMLAAAASADPAPSGTEFLLPTWLGSESPPDSPANVNWWWFNPDYIDYGRLPSVSAGDQVVLVNGWAGFSQGRIQTVPDYMMMQVEVWQGRDTSVPPWLTLTPKQAKAYWGSLEFTSDEPDLPAFNPNIGAKFYAIHWFLELKPLVPGDYTVHYYQYLRHPMSDLSSGYHDGQHKPFIWKPADSTLDSWFWFTVAL